jgi:hypothetical protein
VENFLDGMLRALGFQEGTGMVGSTLPFSAKAIVKAIKSVFMYQHVENDPDNSFIW